MNCSITLPLDLKEADLIGPVHHLLGSDSIVLTDWWVSPLAGGRGEITGGVYRVAGYGQDKGPPVSWSLVLKVVRDPREYDDPGANTYWTCEFLTYQAGLLGELPGIRAPRCVGVEMDMREA
jgi:hypothetical protein